MKQFTALLKKELAGYFLSYSAYFVIALYIFLSMTSNFYIGGYFMSAGADLYSFFYFQPQILVFLVPALAMRSWSEEKKTGTYELLLSYPLSYKAMVMAKFIACFIIAIMMIVMTFPLWVYTSFVANVDNYTILYSYIGCFLVVGMFCAVVCFISATNSSQIVSYLISVFVLWLATNVDYNFIIKPLAYISSEMYVLAQGVFNFSSQFNAFLSAQIGFDNFVYFISFIVVALFLNKYVVEERKEKSWAGLSMITILLVVLLIMINVLSAMLFSANKFDFTSDKRYSLSSATENVLASVYEPIDVKVYISDDIRKISPSLADYSKFVVNYLEKYKQGSGGKINVDVRPIERYSLAEREAVENKVTSFVGNNEDELVYFGAVISNSSGNSQTINSFIPERKQYVESDITRAVYNLTKKNKKKIGWVNSLGANVYEDLILSALAENYDVVQIDNQEIEISNDIDTLVVVNLQNASRFLSYATDQFLLRGKNVLAFVDAFNPQMKNKPVSAYVDSLLGQWGIGYDNRMAVADNLQAGKKVVGEGSNKRVIDDILSINVDKNYISQENMITSGLANISFNSPVLLKYYEGGERLAKTLITSSDKSGLVNIDYIRYFDDVYVKDNQQRDSTLYPLALLVEGKAFSIFGKNLLANTKFEDEIAPFLPLSMAPAKFMVVADADVLDASGWSYFGDAITPYSLIIPNNNLDFLIRSLDYLSGNHGLLGVGGKENSHNRESIGEKIRAKATENYKDEIISITKNISQKEAEVVEIAGNISKQFAMSKVRKLENINKELGELKERSKYINYVITKKTVSDINIIIVCMSLLLPLVLCLLIFIFMQICGKIKRFKVLEMLNEK